MSKGGRESERSRGIERERDRERDKGLWERDEKPTKPHDIHV
jgi:hypothetical protein